MRFVAVVSRAPQHLPLALRANFERARTEASTLVAHFAHKPVMLLESVDHLGLRPGSVVIDGTLGGAGHAAAILEPGYDRHHPGAAPDGAPLGLQNELGSHLRSDLS